MPQIEIKNGAIDVWCESDYAVKCYRLSVREFEALVRDLDASATFDGWGDLTELCWRLGWNVWLTLQDYCADNISGDSYASAVALPDVLAALGLDVSALQPAEDPRQGT